MTKHTPEFREQIAIHIEMLLDDEMRAHAYADKTHELEFQVFRVLGGYREALDSIKVKDTRIAELEAELRRAFDMLGLHGVPEGRAGTVANGIDVLATRYRKDFDSLRYELSAEREKVDRLRDVVADLIAGGESAEQADPRLGYIELQTDRETLARAREALAVTTQRRPT